MSKRRKSNKYKGQVKYRKSHRGYNYNPSKGESKVIRVLESLKLSYVVEVEFRDLKSHYFDFYIPNKNIIIEFDGEQHFTADNCFDNGCEDSFNYRRQRDGIKNRFCYQNNIKMVRIPFNHSTSIENIITKALLTKLKPSKKTSSTKGSTDYSKVKKRVKQKNKDKRLLNNAYKAVLKEKKKETTVVGGVTYYRKLRKL